MKILILLICLSITLNEALDALIFNTTCKFSYENFGSKSFSCCTVAANLQIHNENATLNVKIVKERKRTEAFSAKDKEIFYLPKGIGNFFTNLEVLEIFNSSLRKITAQNLKEFPFLKYLSLSHNKIEYLESDLFRHIVKLNTVNLNDNLISLVEPTFMKIRQDLTVIAFERNVCFSGSANIKAELDEIVVAIKILCSSFIKNININLIKNNGKIEELGIEQTTLNKTVNVLMNRSTNYHKFQTNQSQLIDSLQNQDNRFNLSIRKLQDETTALNQCPDELSNLNTILMEVAKNYSVKIQSVENKISDIENYLKNTSTEIVNMRNKSINNIKTELSLNLTNLEEKLRLAENDINEKIDNNFNTITNQMNDKINDTEIRFKKNLETLLNSTNNKLSDRLMDIQAIANLFDQTIGKISNLTNQSIKLIKKSDNFEQRLSKFEASANDTQSTLSNVSNKIKSIELSIKTKLNETIETLFMKNFTILDNKHQVAINQMQNNIKYLIISNVILITLLILAASYFIYNLKFKSNSNAYNHIQRNNSSCHQFNTISTHVALHDQYNEPVYDSTNHNDEPIYEAFESPYSAGDNDHYQTADNVKYAQVEFNLYEATDDSANLVHEDQEGLYNDSMYDVTSSDVRHKAVDNSHNDSTDDDIIYEVGGHSETIKADSIAVSDENLYSELPAKINDTQDEFELYSIVKKG